MAERSGLPVVGFKHDLSSIQKEDSSADVALLGVEQETDSCTAEIDPNSGQAQGGPSDWRTHYADWENIGPALDKDIPYDEPLTPTELEFVRKLGFEFRQRIGVGGFGAVWAVECSSHNLEGWYACKVLDLKEYRTASNTKLHEAVDFMLRECDLMQSVIHDNIARVANIFHIKDQFSGFPMIRVLLFMELCNGDIENLMRQYPDHKLDEDMARDVMRQVCQGLKLLHSKNIVHFDIKPKNILYKQDTSTGDLVFKLTDFGLSQRFDKGNFMVLEAKGTHIYMDPCLEEPGESDARKADIYSLGSTLVAMLVSCQDMDKCRSQFNMSSSTQTKVTANWPKIVTILSSNWEISTGAANLIRKMTRTDWQLRPTIDEVIDDQWMTGE